MRIFRIPVGNGVLLVAYGIQIFRMSLSFRRNYAVHPVLTIAFTNLLLLGLSDTLAQTLRSIGNNLEETADENPFMRFVLDNGRMKQVWLDEATDDLNTLGLMEADTGNYSDDEVADEPQESHLIVKNSFLEFDFRRWALFSSWGLATSPLQCAWYAFLRSAYSADAKLVTIVQRVLADQLLYSPIMLTCFLFYLGVVVEGQSPRIIKDSSFWQKYVSTLSMNLSIWPLAQFINFLLIPNSAQIPFSSCISVLWNTYLSLNTQ